MADEGEEETWEVLDDYRMSREGLHVKLDRGSGLQPLTAGPGNTVAC
jgi:hypothetical protein